MRSIVGGCIKGEEMERVKGIEPVGLLALHWGNGGIVVRGTQSQYTRGEPQRYHVKGL